MNQLIQQKTVDFHKLVKNARQNSSACDKSDVHWSTN